MSTVTLIGLILMVLAGLLFGFQVMAGFLGMGTSDDYVYENIRLEEILGESTLNWIDGISSPAIRGLSETVVSTSLVVILLGGAILFFLIHLFRGHK